MIFLKGTKKIIITIILILIVINLVGCGNENKNEELQKKVITELEFVNIKIIDLLNALNNLNFNNYTISTEQVKLDQNTEKEEDQQKNAPDESVQGDESGSQVQGETRKRFTSARKWKPRFNKYNGNGSRYNIDEG